MSLFSIALLPNLLPLRARVFRLFSEWRAGIAFRVCQHYRGDVADGAVRSFFVVVSTPCLHCHGHVTLETLSQWPSTFDIW